MENLTPLQGLMCVLSLPVVAYVYTELEKPIKKIIMNLTQKTKVKEN